MEKDERIHHQENVRKKKRQQRKESKKREFEKNKKKWEIEVEEANELKSRYNSVSCPTFRSTSNVLYRTVTGIPYRLY